MALSSVAASAKRALQQSEQSIVPLPKGSFAIAHIQHSAYHLHTGMYHWSRFYIVKVISAKRDGTVKTFVDNPVTGAPKRVDRHTTIYSLPAQYLVACEKVFSATALDFIGYEDKQSLKAALESAI